MDRSFHFIKKHTGLLSKWLLPYVILLIVPLIINIYTFTMMDKVVHDQTVASNSLVLSQVKQNVDRVFAEVNQAYIQLFFLDILKADRATSDPSSIQYDVHKTMESLKTIGLSYPSITGIVLYNQAADFVITGGNASGSRSYFEAFNPFGNASYEEFLQVLQGKYSGGLTEAQVTSRDGVPAPALIYQKTIFDMYNSAYGYNVFFILENNVLYNQVQQTDLFQNGMFAMVDGQDSHIITMQGDKKLSGDLTRQLLGGDTESSVIASNTNSEIFNIQYYMLMPENRFWAQKRSIGRMFLLSIILCLILGILVIVSSARHNYNPLKNLSDIIRRKSGLLQSDEDLTSIYQSAGNMIEQYSRVLSTQTASLRTAFLQRFIRGREEGDTLQEHFKTYHIEFVSDKFIVALIYIEDYSAFFEGAEDLSRDEKFGFAHLTVTNIFEELCADFCRPYYVDLDYTIGYIINLKPGAPVRLHDTLAQMQEFVKDHFGISTSIGISGQQTGAANVPVAYNQALEALDYRTVVGLETIIEYSQLRRGSAADVFYPLDLEQQLIGCIKAGKLEEATQTLDIIYQTNLSDQTLSSDAARCLMFNLISTMMKAISTSGGATHCEVDSEQYIAQLFDCTSVQEVHDVVLDMIRAICEVNRQSDQQKGDLIPKIITYIKEHFQDPALSVSEVAAEFSFHPTYLSNAFKAKTGQGLYDFIKEVRIDAAKVLLKNSSETVTVIAEQCGFTNSKTFTRTFKSITGLTPGKFRDV